MEVLMQMAHHSNRRKFRVVKAVLVPLVFLTALWMTLFSRRGLAFEGGLPPAKESMAYKQYQKQPKSEMAKLNYLFSRFGKAEGQVVYDGHEYEIPEAIKTAKGFLFRRYNKETADYWVKNYCYKSDAGNIIMFKGKDGSLTPVRDAILKELAVLQKTG